MKTLEKYKGYSYLLKKYSLTGTEASNSIITFNNIEKYNTKKILSLYDYDYEYDAGTSSTTSFYTYPSITTAWNSTSSASYYSQVAPAALPAADRIRAIIQNRQAPMVMVRTATVPRLDDKEFRARQTLRMMIGEQAFRDFLKKGFVSLRAKSGRVYQIFPGHRTTVCWENGKPIKNLCVVLRGGFTPTDELIMRYILISTDEQNFWERANVTSGYAQSRQQNQPDSRPLLAIWSELKSQEKLAA